MSELPESSKQPVEDTGVPQERSIPRRLIAGIAAGALVLGLAGYGVSRLIGGLPEQRGTPEDSEIEAVRVALVVEDLDCKTLSVYDASGSKARTVYSINGLDLSFTGYGALMERGQFVKETCVEGGGVSISDVVVDGEPKKQVDIEVSAITHDTKVNIEGTHVQPVDPSGTMIVGGALDFVSGAAKLFCQGVGSVLGQPLNVEIGGKEYSCDAVTILSDWNNGNQETLKNALISRVEEEVQVTCGQAGWDTERLALIDGFRLQAFEQDVDPNDVIVRFVNDDGNPTDAAPDFEKSTWDALYADGTLTETIPFAPELVFESITCTDVDGVYTPQFPDGYQVPPVISTPDN